MAGAGRERRAAAERARAARRDWLSSPRRPLRRQGGRGGRAVGEVSLAPRRDPTGPSEPAGTGWGAHLHICHPRADWPPARGPPPRADTAPREGREGGSGA